jgi:hypothetical protein
MLYRNAIQAVHSADGEMTDRVMHFDHHANKRGAKALAGA